MPRTRFVLLTNDYPPNVGGVARYLSNLVEASQGEIEVIDTRSMYQNMWPRWLPLINLCFSVRHNINHVPEGGQEAPTILISHVFPVGTAAWISRLFGGPRYVVLFHGLDLRLARGIWKRWLLRRICASAETLFCVSEATRKTLYERVPGATAIVLTPGVEGRTSESRAGARQQLCIDPAVKIVLSVSRLVPRKGIDVALQAMGRIQSKLEQVGQGTLRIGESDAPEQSIEYVVVGDGARAETDRLTSIATEAGVRVRWIRSASDDEKWLWFAAADIFLLPVRDEGDDVEGFGIVYAEAAKASVPSIAGNSGGAPEAVLHERTGLVVEPESIDAIQAAIERLLQDSELRQRLGDAARVRVETDFRWPDRWKLLSERVANLRQEIRPAADIAIVIPCYEHARDLHRTLEALTKQTCPAREIIVVDDCSTDDPESVVNAFATLLPIHFLRLRHNHGAPYARNEGARLTSAPYLLFLDADVSLVPDALETFGNTLAQRADCDFSYSSFFWGHKLFRGALFEMESLKQRNFIHTSSLLRRSAFSGFDESLKKFQDWDLWLTMARKGSRGVFIDRALFRVAPRKEGYSRWLPKIAYRIPWQKIGFEPREIQKYRAAESIVRKKHGL